MIAYASLGVQMEGLFFSKGLAPAAELFRFLGSRVQHAAWRFPSLAWLGASDTALELIWAAGTAAAGMVTIGLVPRASLFVAWLCYLSLVVAGGPFMSFQWDTLLLETSFAALFVAPLTWLDRPDRAPEPPRLCRWLLMYLVLRLMFASGWIKLASDDPTWWGLTALAAHYETQPLPNPVAWHMHHMPMWFHQLCAVLMFAIELAVPFAIFLAGWPRRLAALAFSALMLVIVVTGNYGFFNLLALVLCVPLIDDAVLLRIVPRRWRDRLAERDAPRRPTTQARARTRLGRAGSVVVVAGLVLAWTIAAPGEHGLRFALAMLALIGGVVWVRMAAAELPLARQAGEEKKRTRRGPPPSIPSVLARQTLRATREALAVLALIIATMVFAAGFVATLREPVFRALDDLEGFSSFNSYGLFARMTTERPEIVIEGSRDGTTWKPYELPYKPGALERRPPWLVGHMPRLDWQLWFAALGDHRHNPWLMRLLGNLVDGEPSTVALFSTNPFEDVPPRHARAIRHRYRFSAPEDKRIGRWWRRQGAELYAPVVSARKLGSQL